MKIKNEWEFNVLGVYHYLKPGEKSNYFDYIIENHNHIEGDIYEAGVFNGASLLATGLLLKELGSSKHVYGFDSFEGFPPVYHEKDELSQFDQLFNKKTISEKHYADVQKNKELRSLLMTEELTVSNISSSANFVCSSLEGLQRKIKYLGLDNVHLIKGPFNETMSESQSFPTKIMAGILDCDLYLSYQTALPFIWSRLSKGGYIFLDEYYSIKFPGARIATNEFFDSKQDKPQQHKYSPGDFERWFVRKNFGF